MPDTILLRFDAPLVSFGAPVVDHLGRIQPYPALSMLTGLVGNALGYEHGQHELLQSLQRRIEYAVRCDVDGRRVVDYQTVDLGQPFLDGTGWTTRGMADGREGGKASKETHIRYREYLADSVYTVALTLKEPEVHPTLDHLEVALRSPARPLFLGRKCCLPSAPVLMGRVQAASLLAALREAAASPRAAGQTSRMRFWWTPDGPAGDLSGGDFETTDERDWANQIHCGRRLMRQGLLELKESNHD